MKPKKIKSFARLSGVIYFFLMATFCFTQPAIALPGPTALPPLTEQELNAVVKEIQAMVKTSEEMAENFVVREATPSRIDRFYQTPGFLQQPTAIRENGLIFAGQGSLLSFNKPSDIITLLSSLFPKEISAAQVSKSQSFFGFIHLYGPYSNWQDEPAAFLTLWNCMPQIAWLKPEQNPFTRRLGDSNPFMAIADRSSGQSDFGACVRERSGRIPVWKKEDIPAMQKKLLDTGNRLTPVLQNKFARFLAANRCKGTGPDDCVLNLLLWSSLSPTDTKLAQAIQTLESDISPDGPLPDLNMESPASTQPTGHRQRINSAHRTFDQYGSFSHEGEPHFDEALRKAAFLRAKLLSVLNAENAWPAKALQTTLHQITLLRKQSDAARNFRWNSFDIYKNYEVDPWYALSLDSGKRSSVQAAVMGELDSLAKDKSCDILQEWLNSVGNPLKTSFAFNHLSDEPALQCFAPDWELLKTGQSEAAQDLRKKYLGLLGHEGSGAVHEMLLNQLTSYGNNCFDNDPPLQAWLSDVCKTWVSEPQHTPFSLINSRLTLIKEKQFQSTRLQLPLASSTEPQDIKPWLTKLVQGMSSEAQLKMQALIEKLKARKDTVDSAIWWHHPGYDKSLLELQNHGPNVNSRVLLVFEPHSFTLSSVPDRFLGQYEHNEIVHVSDLDDDGNLELWWAESFHKCQEDDTDLERGMDCSANMAEMGEIMGDTLTYFSNTAQTYKHPRVQQAPTPHPLPAAAMPVNDVDMQRVCNAMLIGSIMKKKLDINFRSRIKDGVLIDVVCKPHPLHPEQTIVALFYDLNDEASTEQNSLDKKGFALAVLDVKKRMLLSLYRDTVEEDATTRISQFSLQIDTARYNLATGVRALGVRMNIGWSPRYAEGGENQFLTLFVEKGSQLKPVLKNLAMSAWSITRDSGCGADNEDCAIDNIALTINVLPTMTDGWHDLEVVAHHQIVTEMQATGKGAQPTPRDQVLYKLRAKRQMYQRN